MLDREENEDTASNALLRTLDIAAFIANSFLPLGDGDGSGGGGDDDDDSGVCVCVSATLIAKMISEVLLLFSPNEIRRGKSKHVLVTAEKDMQVEPEPA